MVGKLDEGRGSHELRERRLVDAGAVLDEVVWSIDVRRVVAEHGHRRTLPAAVLEAIGRLEPDFEPEASFPVANGNRQIDYVHGASPNGRVQWYSLDETEGGAGRSRSSNGHGSNAKDRDTGVPGDTDEPLGPGLGNQHPIDRVAVMRRQDACPLRMAECDEQRREPLLSDPGFQVVRCLHLAKGTLDGNLPTADHADEYLVSCDLHGPASRFAQPSRLGERPQDDVCVDYGHQNFATGHQVGAELRKKMITI